MDSLPIAILLGMTAAGSAVLLVAWAELRRLRRELSQWKGRAQALLAEVNALTTGPRFTFNQVDEWRR